MKASLTQQVIRALDHTRTEHSDATLIRIGACVANFCEAEARGETNIHPELYIAGLPATEQDAARACFDALDALKSLDI